MKRIIIILITVISLTSNAQNNYEKGMQKALELWQSDKWTEAENLFERIANAELDQWLPHYYIAQMNSLKSWNEKDAETLKANLDKAQSHLNLAKSISKDHPEILVMQAQVYTNWVAFDGATYGMKYAASIAQIYAKANKLDPTNPRAAFCKADWAMGSARYFGKDTAPFCKEIEQSLTLFTTFKPESDLHPNWGEDRAKQVLKDCK